MGMLLDKMGIAIERNTFYQPVIDNLNIYKTIRTSMVFYNTREIDRFTDALTKARYVKIVP